MRSLVAVRRSGLFASAVLAAGLSACASDPASAPERVEVAAHRSAARGGSRYANAQKYRDTSRPKSVGTSPITAVTVEALVNTDGSLSLEATSYAAGDLTTPRGTITKLQVKLFDGSGRLVATLNFNQVHGNPVAVAIPAIPLGGTAAILAHVAGIAGRRTDVVAVAGITPTLRPDLAVTNVDAPYQMVVGQLAVLSATVTELQGQRGARANCVLYVNDVRTDLASAIWVDAGDAVSCAFTGSFPSAGTTVLRFALEAVVPGDADLNNNQASLTIVVAEQAPVLPGNFIFDGEVRDGDIQSADSAYTRWTERATGQVILEQANGFRSSGHVQSAFVVATAGEALPLPLERLEVAMRSGGRLLHADRWAAFGAATGDPACASATPVGGFSVFLCSYAAAGFTAIQYVLNAGSVTYQSVEYSRTWNGATYDENIWVDNYTDPASPVAPVLLGGDFSFHIVATTGGATYAFGGSGSLSPLTESFVMPLTCNSFVLTGPPAYDVFACGSSLYSFTGIAGALHGSGLLSRSTASP